MSDIMKAVGAREARRRSRRREIIDRCCPGMVIMSNPDNNSSISPIIIMITNVDDRGSETMLSYIYNDPASNGGQTIFVNGHFATSCILWDDIIIYDPDQVRGVTPC